MIDNDDELCLARAIVVGQARHERNIDAEHGRRYDNIRRGERKRNTAQKKAAVELMEQAGLAEHSGGCGLEEIQKIQDDVLTPGGWQLKVFWKENFGGLLFKGID